MLLKAAVSTSGARAQEALFRVVRGAVTLPREGAAHSCLQQLEAAFSGLKLRKPARSAVVPSLWSRSARPSGTWHGQRLPRLGGVEASTSPMNGRRRWGCESHQEVRSPPRK
eukprot:6677366-Alexandrium_andersonii.AAC.1